LVYDLGASLDKIDVDHLVKLINERWDQQKNSNLRIKIENNITLCEWGNIVIKRKLNANVPGTAKWLFNAMTAIKNFNKDKDISLHDISVSFLEDFESHHLGKGNSKNTVAIYLRAIRSLYNGAIKEDRFKPVKHTFEHYRIPKLVRTRKRAITKEEMLSLKNLNYQKDTAIWNAVNYALVMFYCRGMNFVDLVQLKAGSIQDDRLYYGRSKTDQPLSVGITEELRDILQQYLQDKEPEDYLFPTNYDGSTEHFQKYVSQRRRMNERLKTIAKDAGIDADLTTYTIRHTWATAAKHLGVSTELISESLGHHSVTTTEIYLKDFENEALDEVNRLVITS
jgi:site-specific recombinase XerD